MKIISLLNKEKLLSSNKLPCSKLQGSPSGKFVLRQDAPRQSCRVFRSQNKGLTLIEVLVAFVVLGLTATLFYQAFVSAAWSGAGSKYRIEALNLARKQVEYLMSKDFNDAELYALGGTTIPVTTGNLANMNGKIVYTIESAPNNQDKKITVKVTWDEP